MISLFTRGSRLEKAYRENSPETAYNEENRSSSSIIQDILGARTKTDRNLPRGEGRMGKKRPARVRQRPHPGSWNSISATPAAVVCEAPAQNHKKKKQRNRAPSEEGNPASIENCVHRRRCTGVVGKGSEASSRPVKKPSSSRMGPVARSPVIGQGKGRPSADKGANLGLLAVAERAL